MPKIYDWDQWIDKLLRREQVQGMARGVTITDNLHKIVLRMQRYQKELNIPDRDIKIIDYLARNPLALIIQDENVKRAFYSARRAMSL